jgi:hypothetical protein
MPWCNRTLIIVALFGTIVEVVLGKSSSKIAESRCESYNAGSTFDTWSVDVLNMLGWESLDQRRNYTKSIYMYKIINDHAAPNLKQLFRRCSEGDSLCDLRNRETDLVLPKPKKEFLVMELSIGIICLLKQKALIPFIHSRES